MVALSTVFYNSARMYKTLGCTPAMAAGLTGKLWSMEDVVALIDAKGTPKARGTYNPRQSKAA